MQENKKKFSEMSRFLDELRPMLMNEQQMEKLEQIENFQLSLIALSEKDAFIEGFRRLEMKRFAMIGSIVICLLLMIGTIMAVSAADSYLRGDADGDGVVTIMDATVIQRYLEEFDNIHHINETVTILAPTESQSTTPEPTTPQPMRDPCELAVVQND